MTQNTPARS